MSATASNSRPLVLKVFDDAGLLVARKAVVGGPGYTTDEVIYHLHLKMTELFKDALYHAFGHENYDAARRRALELFVPERLEFQGRDEKGAG